MEVTKPGRMGSHVLCDGKPGGIEMLPLLGVIMDHQVEGLAGLIDRLSSNFLRGPRSFDARKEDALRAVESMRGIAAVETTSPKARVRLMIVRGVGGEEEFLQPMRAHFVQSFEELGDEAIAKNDVVFTKKNTGDVLRAGLHAADKIMAGAAVLAKILHLCPALRRHRQCAETRVVAQRRKIFETIPIRHERDLPKVLGERVAGQQTGQGLMEIDRLAMHRHKGDGDGLRFPSGRFHAGTERGL